MSKAGWLHGSTVDPDTREVRYLSASSLKLADMSTEKGCTRKWWYAYVKGIKEPPTWQQEAGTRDHACVEAYLETGKRVFSPRVAKGVHMLPPPGGLLIEHDMVPILWEGKDKCPACLNGITPDNQDGQGIVKHTCKKKSGLHLAPLRAAGIPIVGRIDLMHDLCINYGTDHPENIADPEGTIEVFDHKFTKDLRYALKGTDMIKDIQMVAYGEYVFRTVPHATRVRLSHGYYPTNGNAVKRTILTDRAPLSAFWSEHVEPLARSIADAAKEQNPDKVPANLKACKAFGRPCIHAEYCSAAMDAGVGQNLQSQLGATSAQSLIQLIRKTKDSNTQMPALGKGLLAHIKKQPADDTAAREAELAKLKAEEHAAKLATLPKDLLKTIGDIETIAQRNHLGWPTLQGKALEAYTLVTGQSRAATGDLEAVEIAQAEQFATLLEELSAAYPAPATATAAAPAINAGMMPDDAPDAPVPAVATPAQKPTDIVEQPKEPRAKRKAKESEPAPTPTVGPVTKAPDSTPVSTANMVYNLFVDVAVEGAVFRDFATVVDTLAEAIATKFNVSDIRNGAPDSGIGYGKWKGVLAAAIREADILEPGTYYIDARGNEIYEEAVQALRQRVKRSGGVFLRGVR